LLGLTGSVAIDRLTEFLADLRNLTNKKAAGDIGAVVAWTPDNAIFYPVERRAFSVGVRSRFGGGTR